MKHFIFQEKQEYINMKQRWAEQFNTWARNIERNEYGNKIKKLTATHFALYAILRGKDPYTSLNNACGDTIEEITYDIVRAKTSTYYDGYWKTFFGITQEQHDKMIDIAYDIFKNKKDFEVVQNNLKEDLTA